MTAADFPPWYKHEVTSRFSSGTILEGAANDPAESKKSSRDQRFTLLEASREILLGFYGKRPQEKANGFLRRHRTCDCNRGLLGGSVQIMTSLEHPGAFYAGLAQCASVWTCPVCSAKISERRGAEMRIALGQSEALSLIPHMITFTAPHTASDKVDALAQMMGDALAAFWRERAVKSWKFDRDIVGHIRAYEIRKGANGWHPHFHILVFSRFSLIDDRETVLKVWQRVCERTGLSCPNQHGIDIADGSAVGEYLSKYGSDGEVLSTRNGKPLTWDAADEMTRANSKKSKTGKGRPESFSPWDLLHLYAIGDKAEKKTQRVGYDFLCYARAFKGKSQLRWSRGLRAVFELAPALSDEDVVAAQEDTATILAELTPTEWAYVIGRKERSLLLRIAEEGGASGVADYLRRARAADYDRGRDLTHTSANAAEHELAEVWAGRSIREPQANRSTQPPTVGSGAEKPAGTPTQKPTEPSTSEGVVKGKDRGRSPTEGRDRGRSLVQRTLDFTAAPHP